MPTYIIGDVQGCYQQLCDLLEKINYSDSQDRLGFVGDLVNRGPHSLEVLRFIKQLKNPIVVLGNHDLFALALGYGVIDFNEHESTIQDVMQAPDKIELLDWLRQQKLAHIENNYFIVHAGIIPQWSVVEALHYAEEVMQALNSENYLELLGATENLYGNDPLCWDYALTGVARLRFIVNTLTRIRFCDARGCLDFNNKTAEHSNPHMQPWFNFYKGEHEIIYGHWAALQGQCNHPKVHAIDTGCVWGGKLTAIRLEDRRLFSV